ncbi:MAG: hypothetical protein U9R20_03510, partial [Thermodesulfobacteriota bacterium]|nr:hypothetical protein [Thermodesulfobacteriota bacterium]
PSDFSAYRRIAREENMWRSHDQVICSMDSVKPLESRRGWSDRQMAEYNQERFEDLISAGWDLIVVDKVIARLKEQAQDAKASSSVLGATEELEPSEAQRLMDHPLPHWVERMTVSYLNAHGGKAERKRQTWNLTWPDGETITNVVFSNKESDKSPTARHLTLEDSRIRGLAIRLPRFVPGQPISVVTIPGITDEVTGLWSLWRIGITTMEWNHHRIMPLFIADGGKVFAPTARHLWDKLLGVTPNVLTHLDLEEFKETFDRLAGIAEEQGRTIYDELVQEHRSRLTREREKGEYAFAARRSVIERIGLSQVRDHRLNFLRQEEQTWKEDLKRKAQVYPEMVPLIIVRVEGNRE